MEKSKRGGKRKGAGRSRVDERLRRRPYNTRLPSYIIDWLRESAESQSVIIEKALVYAYGIEKPDIDAD